MNGVPGPGLMLASPAAVVYSHRFFSDLSQASLTKHSVPDPVHFCKSEKGNPGYDTANYDRQHYGATLVGLFFRLLQLKKTRLARVFFRPHFLASARRRFPG